MEIAQENIDIAKEVAIGFCGYLGITNEHDQEDYILEAELALCELAEKRPDLMSENRSQLPSYIRNHLRDYHRAEYRSRISPVNGRRTQ